MTKPVLTTPKKNKKIKERKENSSKHINQNGAKSLIIHQLI